MTRAAIPEEQIMQHLDVLLTKSAPGDTMHHLHVVSAPPGAVGPFGQPDPEQLHSSIYAIAPTGDVDVEDFIADVIMSAAVEANDKGEIPLFAALSQEVWIVGRDDMDEHALALQRQGRLPEHPAAAEVTVVYGASCDGRRWRGRRWLSGPKAGTTEAVDLLVGRPHPHEAPGVTAAPLLRRLVGIR